MDIKLVQVEKNVGVKASKKPKRDKKKVSRYHGLKQMDWEDMIL